MSSNEIENPAPVTDEDVKRALGAFYKFGTAGLAAAMRRAIEADRNRAPAKDCDPDILRRAKREASQGPHVGAENFAIHGVASGDLYWNSVTGSWMQNGRYPATTPYDNAILALFAAAAASCFNSSAAGSLVDARDRFRAFVSGKSG